VKQYFEVASGAIAPIVSYFRTAQSKVNHVRLMLTDATHANRSKIASGSRKLSELSGEFGCPEENCNKVGDVNVFGASSRAILWHQTSIANGAD